MKIVFCIFLCLVVLERRKKKKKRVTENFPYLTWCEIELFPKICFLLIFLENNSILNKGSLRESFSTYYKITTKHRKMR